MNFGEDLDRCARKLCFSCLVFLAYDLIQDHKVIREKDNHPKFCKYSNLQFQLPSSIWGGLVAIYHDQMVCVEQPQIFCSRYCRNVSKEQNILAKTGVFLAWIFWKVCIHAQANWGLSGLPFPFFQNYCCWDLLIVINDEDACLVQTRTFINFNSWFLSTFSNKTFAMLIVQLPEYFIELYRIISGFTEL